MKAFAEFIGIPQNYISRWKNPDTYHLNIKEENWEKLYPEIKKYLPSGFKPTYADDDNVTTAIRKQRPQKRTALFEDLFSILEQLAPGHQIITGIINVNGVPNEKIIKALKKLNLTEQQEKNFLYEILN